MSAGFQLLLDTTGPQGVAAALNDGASATASVDVTLAATSTDGDVAQALIWGDVDPAFNASIQPLEANSQPVSYTAEIALRLAAGDGVKTIFVKLLDDVGNVSAQASDTINLTSSAPTVTITAGPTATVMDAGVPKVSEVDGFDTVDFAFSTDQDVVAWKVTIVPDQSALEGAGTTLGSANGSTNVTGGALAAATAVSASLDGSDIKAASAPDGPKEIKVFVQNAAGVWSV